MGVEVAVVVGGGNIWRGAAASQRGMDRTMADYMGMLATIMNGIALQSQLEDIGVETRVQTAIEVKNVAEPYMCARPWALGKGPGGHLRRRDGQPVFHHRHHGGPARQRDQGARVILKATKVDGIYTADPVKDPSATALRAHHLHRGARPSGCRSWTRRRSACARTTMCPIIVFDMNQPGNILRAVLGEKVGTLVSDQA